MEPVSEGFFVLVFPFAAAARSVTAPSYMMLNQTTLHMKKKEKLTTNEEAV